MLKDAKAIKTIATTLITSAIVGTASLAWSFTKAEINLISKKNIKEEMKTRNEFHKNRYKQIDEKMQRVEEKLDKVIFHLIKE